MEKTHSHTLILCTASGEENLGDELITLCEYRELKKRFPENSLLIFSHDPQRTKRFFQSQGILLRDSELTPYFPENIRKNILHNVVLFWKMVHIFRNSRYIFIGGGGLLYAKKEEGKSPLFLWWLRTSIMNFFRKKVVFLSLGISAQISELAPYSSGLFRGNTLSVRDTKSQNILHSLGYTSTILPDPVFTYSGIKKTQNMIGIAVRKGFLNDEVLRVCISQFLTLGYEVVLLPHSLHPTNEKSHDGYYLQDFLLPGVHIAQTIEQTLSYYSFCRIILSMRLHSMILATCFHTPFIAISYSQKTDVLMNELKWKYTFDTTVTHEKILTSVGEIESHYDKLTQLLRIVHSQIQDEYSKIFNILLKTNNF